MSQRDPRGYYARLGVPQGASADQIKAAFRRRARNLHPDRNPSPNATAEFQHLEEAYRVLNDPEARARYDTLAVETPTKEQESAREEKVSDPIVCSVCAKVTAQPRYVIYFEVKSFVIVTTRSPIQGIFCPSCSEKTVLKATVVTWLLGWWGFPWGPIYSIQAIFRNLLGGIRPRDVNARLVAYQAWVFARTGRSDLARAVAADALGLAEGTKRDDKGIELRRSIHALLAALDDGTPTKHLRSGWAVSSRPSLIQAGLILGVVATIWGVAAHEPPAAPRPMISPPVSVPSMTPPPMSLPPTAIPPVKLFTEAVQKLPENGAYRRHWSHYEGEVLAPLRISTAGGSPNHFVKVVEWDTGAPILTVFIRSGQTVQVQVPLGSYRLKYAAGSEWYGERHLFGPDTSYARAESRFDFTVERNQVSGFRVELIKQVGGNLKTANIRPEDF